MSKNQELQQLLKLSLKELKAKQTKAEARKSELETAKAKGGSAWTDALQEELDDQVLYLVDLAEAIEAKKSEPTVEREVASESAPEVAATNKYMPAPGSEKSIHLLIVRGSRFDRMTGKEISAPFVQIFSYAEWQLFKKNYKSLGYTIKEVLHDPYGEAQELVAEK